MAERRIPRGRSKTGKGEKYGPEHRRARAAAARRHDPTDPCARCGKPLGPMGPHLHYDHAETSGYLGFSCADCNRLAGARKGGRISTALNRQRRNQPDREPWRSTAW